MYSDPPISESAIPELFERLGPIFGAQIAVELRPVEERESPGRTTANFSVRVAWGAERFEFAAEAKMRSTPRVLEEALRQARRWAAESGTNSAMTFCPLLMIRLGSNGTIHPDCGH